MKYKHLFGPVASRRLGISLGIDLIPHKTCNFNCICVLYKQYKDCEVIKQPIEKEKCLC